jgi:hypothetical protein
MLNLEMPNMTVGDFCDHYTIGQIKEDKIKGNISKMHICYMGNIREIMYKKTLVPLFEELMNRLYKINEEIWNLMDKIVQEQDLTDVGITAKSLVQANFNRVRIKNEISQIFNDPIEHKNYGKGTFKL